MELIVHKNIADLYRALNLPIEQALDFTIHFLPDIHPAVPFESPVFRAEYYSFVFLKNARGTYTVDEKSYVTKPGTIYFTNPGHIKAFYIEEMQDAYIITLSESFLKENVHPNIFDEFPFLLAEIVPPKQLSPADFKIFENLYLQIYAEFHQHSPFKEKILGNLFVVLLLKIKEHFWLDYDPMDEGDRNSQIVHGFKKILAEQFSGKRLEASREPAFQAQDYAFALQLHPNYLNQVIKAKTGKTVQQWIQKKMTSSAKALLRNTKLPVKEIAYRLGFSEATHFSRFFKNQTRLTPGKYRKS